MAESVSMDYKQLSFDSAFCQVELLDAKIIEMISARYDAVPIAPSNVTALFASSFFCVRFIVYWPTPSEHVQAAGICDEKENRSPDSGSSYAM